MDYKNEIKNYYKLLIDTMDKLNYDEINEAMNAIERVYQREGYIYICGNGGSAANASHYANDFNKGISEHVDKKFRFYCLNDNYPTVMAIANDISYDDVFSFQLDGRITEKDMLIALSGSGNSKNIVRAVEKAQQNGAKVLGISGYKGGKLYEMADYHMHVPIEDMQISEDIHMTFNHMMYKVFLKTLTNSDK